MHTHGEVDEVEVGCGSHSLVAPHDPADEQVSEQRQRHRHDVGDALEHRLPQRHHLPDGEKPRVRETEITGWTKRTIRSDSFQ